MAHPILITGGTQRLGLAIAEDLLAQSHKVIITYRTPKPAVEHLKNLGATLVQADFSTQQGIERAIAEIKSVTSGLRGIIHNASDWAAESADTSPAELMNKMMAVHVHAPYQFNLALQSWLQSTEGFADIIHMTDFVQEVGSTKHIAYSASKAALHNLTLSFARQFAPQIKVNSIAPALLMYNEWDDEAYRQKAPNRSLLKHVPGAVEAVKAVNYLLNSEFITGQTIHLNGGRHLLVP